MRPHDGAPWWRPVSFLGRCAKPSRSVGAESKTARAPDCSVAHAVSHSFDSGLLLRGDLRTHSGLLDSLSNSPSRSPRDGCHRATRVPSSSFLHSHGMWTKHASWGSMRGEGLCALRTRTQLLPFHEPGRLFSCDARDHRMPLRVRFLSAMRVARRRPGLWRHCEPARLAWFLHRSCAGASSRSLKRKTACDADHSASHAVLVLTWTRLDSFGLTQFVARDPA